MSVVATAIDVTLGKASILAGVNITLRKGRVTAIIGPNGAGKTTLIRALAGLVPLSSGSIAIEGEPLANMPLTTRARTIGYLPQIGQPHWNISARDLVGLGRLPHRSAFAALSPSDEAAITTALTDTDTLTLADRPVDELSGGERARVKLARVLAGDPAWILADEPLANLDPPHARDVLTLLRKAATNGKGVAVVLHQLSAAAEVADDVIIMRSGAIIAAGPCTDVLLPDTLHAAFDMAFDVIPHEGKRVIVPRG
jgi:iron complex transport system ATP-binding protein